MKEQTKCITDQTKDQTNGGKKHKQNEKQTKMK